MYDAEDWTLRKVDHLHLGSFEMWCWRRTEKMVSKSRVGNEEVLHSIKGRGLSHMQQIEGRLTGVVTSCV